MGSSANIFKMSRCLSDAEKWAYMEGLLSHEQQNKIEQHLLDCEACADEIEGTQMLGLENAEKIAEELNAEIMRKVSRTKMRSVVLKRTMATAASIALIIGVALIFRNLSQEKVPEATVIAQNESAPMKYEELPELKKEEQKQIIPSNDELLADEKEESPAVTDRETIAVEEPEIITVFDKTSASTNEINNEIVAEAGEVSEETIAAEVSEEESVENDIAEGAPVESIAEKKEAVLKSVEADATARKRTATAKSAAPAPLAEMSATGVNILDQAYQYFSDHLYQKVINASVSVPKTSPSYYEMQWLKAQSLEKLGRIEECKAVCNILISSESEFKTHATVLLESIAQ